MKYLMVKPAGKEARYYDISHEQEAKIGKLFKMPARPKSFVLDGQTILTEDVLGFTNDKPQGTLGISNIDDLREYVKQQEWYKRSQKREKAKGRQIATV